LKSNELLSKYLFGADVSGYKFFNEQEIYWSESVSYMSDSGEPVTTVVKCKARLDRIICLMDDEGEQVTKVWIPDLKTTGKSIIDFHKTILYYHYHRQLQFYIRAIKKWLIKNFPHSTPDIVPLLIVVETSEYNQSGIYRVPEYYLKAADLEISELLARYAYHKDTDQWKYPLEIMRNGYYTMERTEFPSTQILSSAKNSNTYDI